MTDTSKEGVKRLAKQHDHSAACHGGEDRSDRESHRFHRGTAATLRALVSERDAAPAAVARMGAEMEALRERERALRAELDNVRAAAEKSEWLIHGATGERVKRICLATAAVLRIEAALSAAPPPRSQERTVDGVPVGLGVPPGRVVEPGA